MTADSQLFGFPPGYFIIRSVATDRVLDVSSDEVEDGTEIVLWPAKDNSLVEGLRNPEANNQVFFVDPSGALCSRSSGHAIDVEDDRLVLRHRRPFSRPYPNAYSHPLPQFSYSAETQEITVRLYNDLNSTIGLSGASLDAHGSKSHILTSIPMRKPRTLIDDASAILSSAVMSPLSFFSGGFVGKQLHEATPEEVFNGDIDLAEDQILEQDRGEEGETDDSLDPLRKVLVLTTNPRNASMSGENTRKRRQWQVQPLRRSIARRE